MTIDQEFAHFEIREQGLQVYPSMNVLPGLGLAPTVYTVLLVQSFASIRVASSLRCWRTLYGAHTKTPA